MEIRLREALARGYCSPDNADKVLDPVLIDAMVKQVVAEITPGIDRLTKEKTLLRTVIGDYLLGHIGKQSLRDNIQKIDALFQKAGG
jgi:hypothetical protein